MRDTPVVHGACTVLLVTPETPCPAAGSVHPQTERKRGFLFFRNDFCGSWFSNLMIIVGGRFGWHEAGFLIFSLVLSVNLFH